LGWTRQRSRAGGAVADAARLTPRIMSRHGRARLTPRPRKAVRRGIFQLVDIGVPFRGKQLFHCIFVALVLKWITENNLLDECAGAEIVGLDGRRNRRDSRFV